MIALDDQSHHARLNAVRVDLLGSHRAQVAASDVLEDGQAIELSVSSSRAKNDVGVDHVLEIRLGRDLVAEDVHAAPYHRDGSTQRSLHLLSISPIIGSITSDCDLGRVNSAHNEADEHILVQGRGLRREPVNTEGDVEGDELVRNGGRVVAHNCGRSASSLTHAGIESCLAAISVRGVELASCSRVIHAGMLLHVDRGKEIALADAHGVQRDNTSFDRLVLRAERESDLHVVGSRGRVGAGGTICVPSNRLCRISILVVDGNKPHVHILEEGIAVRAMGGHREEVCLLEVKSRLRREGVKNVICAGRLVVGNAQERVNGVLHSNSSLELGCLVAHLLLIAVHGRLVLPDIRIIDALEDNIAVIHARETAIKKIVVVREVDTPTPGRNRVLFTSSESTLLLSITRILHYIGNSVRAELPLKRIFEVVPVLEVLGRPVVFLHLLDAASRRFPPGCSSDILVVTVGRAREVASLESVHDITGIGVVNREVHGISIRVKRGVRTGNVEGAKPVHSSRVREVHNPASCLLAVALEVDSVNFKTDRKDPGHALGLIPSVHARLSGHGSGIKNKARVPIGDSVASSAAGWIAEGIERRSGADGFSLRGENSIHRNKDSSSALGVFQVMLEGESIVAGRIPAGASGCRNAEELSSQSSSDLRVDENVRERHVNA
mmetsp:Transcript_42115/g.86038  ORF Transcript_42115/g.86038 Transcript_42115/m.86038 type:complete len:667 (+) Transcript_42115:1645-3645(+)